MSEKRTISILAKEKLSQLYKMTADASKRILRPVSSLIFLLPLYSILAYRQLIVMTGSCIFKVPAPFKNFKAL